MKQYNDNKDMSKFHSLVCRNYVALGTLTAAQIFQYEIGTGGRGKSLVDYFPDVSDPNDECGSMFRGKLRRTKHPEQYMNIFIGNNALPADSGAAPAVVPDPTANDNELVVAAASTHGGTGVADLGAQALAQFAASSGAIGGRMDPQQKMVVNQNFQIGSFVAGNQTNNNNNHPQPVKSGEGGMSEQQLEQLVETLKEEVSIATKSSVKDTLIPAVKQIMTATITKDRRGHGTPPSGGGGDMENVYAVSPNCSNCLKFNCIGRAGYFTHASSYLFVSPFRISVTATHNAVH